MAYDIIEKLKKEIGNFKDSADFENIGIITEVSDGIAKISGLYKTLSQEILIIETEKGDVVASAANLEENLIGAIILGSFEGVKIGNRVRKTGVVFKVSNFFFQFFNNVVAHERDTNILMRANNTNITNLFE